MLMWFDITNSVFFFVIYLQLLPGIMSKFDKCDVNFITWNVKGMNNVIKRGNIFSHLRQLNADICFL